MTQQEKINKIQEVEQQIIDLATEGFRERECIFVKHHIKAKRYDIVRAYMEHCVMSVQSKLLDSIVESEYDPVYGSRYKTVKKIDNLITYICQELI